MILKNVLLDNNGIIEIKDWSIIKELLHFQKLNHGVPKIRTKEKSIIIFDTNNYNTAYILDIMDKFLVKNITARIGIKIYYLDDLIIKKLLFPKRDFSNKNSEPIGLITINPEKDEVNIFEEVLVPITEQDIEHIFKQLK
jgi:hypothetical protein